MTSTLTYDDATRVGQSLILLRDGGPRRPVFFIHGGWGQVFQFVRLVSYLPADRPYYALEAVGLWDRQLVEGETHESMAARYLEEIRSVQPEGPIFVLPFSAGGMTAWEIAHLLRPRGEHAEIGLLDAEHPRSWEEEAEPVGAIRAWWNSVSFHTRLMGPMPWSRKSAYVRELIRRRLVTNPYKDNPSKIPGREAISRWALGLGRPAPNGHLEVRDQLTRMRKAWLCEPLDLDVTLFRTSLVEERHESLGWREFIEGELEIVDIPGHHGFMFTEPFVLTLADRVQAWLDEHELANTTSGAIEVESSSDR